jgi:hypothetical protein
MTNVFAFSLLATTSTQASDPQMDYARRLLDRNAIESCTTIGNQMMCAYKTGGILTMSDTPPGKDHCTKPSIRGSVRSTGGATVYTCTTN